jgi:hypothetical protein
MSPFRRLSKLLLLVCALACSTARASSASTDITDMWWNPAESGWGVNIVLQADTAFLTFFVYDAQRHPVWYSAAAYLDAGASPLAWNGDLYETQGPWFNGPFTPPTTYAPVGHASFVLTDVNQATLSYTVNGIAVTKALTRQTWRDEDYTGNYLAGYSVRNANCAPPSSNGNEESGGVMSITHSGAAISLTTTTTAGTCTYTGAYSQNGKLGQVSGNYACSSGVQGPFTLVEMTPTVSGFTSRIVGSNQFCDFSGTFGGVVRAP